MSAEKTMNVIIRALMVLAFVSLASGMFYLAVRTVGGHTVKGRWERILHTVKDFEVMKTELIDNHYIYLVYKGKAELVDCQVVVTVTYANKRKHQVETTWDVWKPGEMKVVVVPGQGSIRRAVFTGTARQVDSINAAQEVNLSKVRGWSK